MFLVNVWGRLNGAAQKKLGGAGVATAAAIFGFIFSAVTFGTIPPANALPSFARQTGQPCGTCHTDFPGLTPYGRKFKLLGYTTGGGPYRTTPFRQFPQFKPDPLDSYANAHDAQSDARKKSALSKDGQSAPGQSDTWVPPISMMAIVGYTHTQAPQDPTGSPYKSNDNVVVSPVSLFYGGAITEHIGAFAQVTWNNAPFGAPNQSDPYATRVVTWDQVDVRYANTAKLAGLDVIYGITANNNPTVQDPWNSTPAWSFPKAYAVSNVAPSPGAGTLIEGALAAHVVGAGAYAFINDLLYVELSGYQTLNFSTQLKLGPDPFAAPGMIDGIAPYWRVALEPHWGNHWLEFGAFGMSARINPWNQDSSALDSNGFFQNITYPQTDRYTDTGFDAQYQYQGANYWFTLRGTYIHENQTLDASFGNSPTLVDGAILAANPTNTLNTFKALASLAYGNDNRVVLTGQYFDIQGSSDSGLYSNNPGCACSPNSNGYVFEIAYIPFISSQAPVWPWANMRVGLQYTYYNKFDGDTVFAHDNNTLFGYLWFAM
jgi:hypothetical protein